MHDLGTRMDDNSSAELANSQAFEDELQSTLKSILALDDSRRGAFQLIYEEEQQNIVVRYFFTILCVLLLIIIITIIISISQTWVWGLEL